MTQQVATDLANPHARAVLSTTAPVLVLGLHEPGSACDSDQQPRDGTTMATNIHPSDMNQPDALNPALDRLLADRAALAATLDRFAGAFTALSVLLVAAPDAEALDRLRNDELLDDWPWQDDRDYGSGVSLLRQSALVGEGEGEVRRDYNRLFFGPKPMIAPPYESVHRSEGHLVFDVETMQVRAAYAQFGLAAPRLNKEPDDHIGLELGFLGALCVRSMDAIDSGDDAELARLLGGLQDFLDVHLLMWGPHCLTLATDGSETFFYQGVAALGMSALRSAKAVFLDAP